MSDWMKRHYDVFDLTPLVVAVSVGMAVFDLVSEGGSGRFWRVGAFVQIAIALLLLPAWWIVRTQDKAKASGDSETTVSKRWILVGVLVLSELLALTLWAFV